ncbi:MAG: hypothetical protein LBJ08_05905, partial [Bifidobacteriaceae bacterium]|nr:hypothetical protein [Bifidobacteriaceae bacterium]
MPIITETLVHDRADFKGNVHFLFAEGAATRAQANAQGYLDLGTFVEGAPKNEVATTEIIKARYNAVWVAGELPGLMKMNYELKTTEVADARKLKYAFFGEDADPFVQPARADMPIDPLAFAGGAATLNTWYPLLSGGLQVRQLTALTFPGLVEGVDFIVDYVVGLVRFIKPGSLPAAPVTPKASCPALDADHPLGLRGFRPGRQASRRGYGRILVFDTRDNSGIVMDHHDFSCDVICSAP